jgi:hypothetical protein
MQMSFSVSIPNGEGSFFVWRIKGVKRLVSLCAGAQGSLNILSNVAAGDFRNCVPPVPLRHFYAISAWGCVGK